MATRKAWESINGEIPTFPLVDPRNWKFRMVLLPKLDINWHDILYGLSIVSMVVL